MARPRWRTADRFHARLPAQRHQLVRAGEPHRVFGSDDDGITRTCPAFARDGALVFGEATGSDEAGWVDAAVLIAT